eukprot:TRINITY_DN71540_c0_g1_i1.p3 TRINITY_DN71540_c0_g1~~TRINITY_DN71540_c0_g1_i1.p3  ORF type:complete len:116 (-),score=2.55 TRINITY_DN71540_c0_g1_i1:36-383(-)
MNQRANKNGKYHEFLFGSGENGVIATRLGRERQGGEHEVTLLLPPGGEDAQRGRRAWAGAISGAGWGVRREQRICAAGFPSSAPRLAPTGAAGACGPAALLGTAQQQCIFSRHAV